VHFDKLYQPEYGAEYPDDLSHVERYGGLCGRDFSKAVLATMVERDFQRRHRNA
jgi:hypothetical protein